MPIMFAVKIDRLKVYMTFASLMTLTFIQDHKCTSNLTSFNLQYLGQYLSHYIQTWHDGRVMDSIYAHFDDLDLAARSKCVCKGQKIIIACSWQL